MSEEKKEPKEIIISFNEAAPQILIIKTKHGFACYRAIAKSEDWELVSGYQETKFREVVE